MARIIFWGDSPNSCTANAYMNRTIIRQLEQDHDVVAFGYNTLDYSNIFEQTGVKSKIITLNSTMEDPYGQMQVLQAIQEMDFDFLVTNNDLWRMWVLTTRIMMLK